METIHLIDATTIPTTTPRRCACCTGGVSWSTDAAFVAAVRRNGQIMLVCGTCTRARARRDRGLTGRLAEAEQLRAQREQSARQTAPQVQARRRQNPRNPGV